MITPHNKALKSNVASTVIMPGDPLRAKYIAENFLDEAVCFNDVRLQYLYTGFYKSKKVTVMSSGMGMPSMGIYSYELFNFYDVEKIIRVGTCGALGDDLNVRDLLFAMCASTDSNYLYQYNVKGHISASCDFDTLYTAVKKAEETHQKYKVGNVISSDFFYNIDSNVKNGWKKMGVSAIDMETAGLYYNAMYFNKKAFAMFTVSDHLYKDDKLTIEEREQGLDKMIQMSLEII